MLSVEEKLQLYQNFINNTQNDIKHREEQNKLREKAISKILTKLRKCNNEEREELLKILSKLLVNKYLAYVNIERDKISLIHNDICRRLMLNEITEEEAMHEHKANQCPYSLAVVEYQCYLYELIGIPINQEEHHYGFSMEDQINNIRKMKIKSMQKK